jgi:hypothetical protein
MNIRILRVNRSTRVYTWALVERTGQAIEVMSQYLNPIRCFKGEYRAV